MTEPLRILTVCTANICRSPVGERFIQSRLDAAGVAAIVRSAGTRGGSLGVHRHTVQAAAAAGIAIDDHRSRLLTREIVAAEGADLVIAMARDHVYEIVGNDATAFGRTFTLRELAQRVSRVDTGGFSSLATLLSAIGRERTTTDLLNDSSLDLSDPYGGPASGHVRMVQEVDALTTMIGRAIAATQHG